MQRGEGGKYYKQSSEIEFHGQMVNHADLHKLRA